MLLAEAQPPHKTKGCHRVVVELSLNCHLLTTEQSAAAAGTGEDLCHLSAYHRGLQATQSPKYIVAIDGIECMLQLSLTNTITPLVWLVGWIMNLATLCTGSDLLVIHSVEAYID